MSNSKLSSNRKGSVIPKHRSSIRQSILKGKEPDFLEAYIQAKKKQEEDEAQEEELRKAKEKYADDYSPMICEAIINEYIEQFLTRNVTRYMETFKRKEEERCIIEEIRNESKQSMLTVKNGVKLLFFILPNYNRVRFNVAGYVEPHSIVVRQDKEEKFDTVFDCEHTLLGLIAYLFNDTALLFFPLECLHISCDISCKELFYILVDNSLTDHRRVVISILLFGFAEFFFLGLILFLLLFSLDVSLQEVGFFSFENALANRRPMFWNYRPFAI